MSDSREAIRVQQADGSWKIVFRTPGKDPAREEPKKEPEAAIQARGENNNKGKTENKKKGSGDGRFFNPMHEGHADIFGRDMIGKSLEFTLLNETIRGKLAGYGQYDVLVESEGKNFILMKAAIVKIEVL